MVLLRANQIAAITTDFKMNVTKKKKRRIRVKLYATAYYYCPRRDFAQKAKSRGGNLVARAYIKGKYLQLKYTVSLPEKKSRFA